MLTPNPNQPMQLPREVLRDIENEHLLGNSLQQLQDRKPINITVKERKSLAKIARKEKL